MVDPDSNALSHRGGVLVYRGVYFGRVVWGKVVEEVILPDTKALLDALEQAEASGAD